MIPEKKTCNRCKTEKPITDFYKYNVKGESKVKASCKICVNKRGYELLKNRRKNSRKDRENKRNLFGLKGRFYSSFVSDLKIKDTVDDYLVFYKTPELTKIIKNCLKELSNKIVTKRDINLSIFKNDLFYCKKSSFYGAFDKNYSETTTDSKFIESKDNVVTASIKIVYSSESRTVTAVILAIKEKTENQSEKNTKI